MDQPGIFLSQLHSAKNEIKSLRDKLEQAQLAASLDGLTKVAQPSELKNH